jgi:ribulose 1,5-bisphosphate synthetase/thiazole synthase
MMRVLQLKHLYAVIFSFAAVISVSAQDSPLLNASSYDYIIVGGGTSGLTVANRLTENGKRTSLLISLPL